VATIKTLPIPGICLQDFVLCSKVSYKGFMGVLIFWHPCAIATILHTIWTVMLDAILVSVAVCVTPCGVNEIGFNGNDDCGRSSELSHAVAGGAASLANAKAAASASSRTFGTETVVAIAGKCLFGAFCQMVITESCEKCDVVLKRVDKT
jgi:hypothetical protein